MALVNSQFTHHVDVFFLPDLPKCFAEPFVDETQCNFRPSTSPLTHSSPSQTSLPNANGYLTTSYFHRLYFVLLEIVILIFIFFILIHFPRMLSPPSSSGGLADKRASVDTSPQSTCSSPSLSRLTYISMNDGTAIPTPERRKVQVYSIVRFSKCN